MPEKYELELDLDEKSADRKLSKFEQKMASIQGKIENFSFGKKFETIGKAQALGRAGGALSQQFGNVLPGYSGMAAQFGMAAGQVFAPNISALMKKGAAPLSALDETIQAFGMAGRNASEKSIQSFFDARLKMKNMAIEGEAGVRNKLGAARLEPITTVTSGLPEAAINDMKHNLKTIADMLKQMLKLPF